MAFRVEQDFLDVQSYMAQRFGVSSEKVVNPSFFRDDFFVLCTAPMTGQDFLLIKDWNGVPGLSDHHDRETERRWQQHSNDFSYTGTDHGLPLPDAPRFSQADDDQGR